MFEKLNFDENGQKVLSQINGKNSGMLMNITVYTLKKGSKLEIEEIDKETAILLTEGELKYHWEGKVKTATRRNVFTDAPYCLHISKDTKAYVTAISDSELIVQQTINANRFASHFYEPSECKIELMGATQWEGTAKREVLTIFDYQNAPYSNMVMGEVITKAGRWSSYVPHSHPQPEVYYYKFDKPQGFGAAFIGEEAYKTADGGACFIPGGLTHPQTTAPGYNMYYCWMIRHLKDNPWTGRDIDPIHAWLLS